MQYRTFRRQAVFDAIVTPKKKPQTLSDLRLIENESAGVRTLDLRIKSPLLYQLSYALNVFGKRGL